MSKEIHKDFGIDPDFRKEKCYLCSNPANPLYREGNSVLCEECAKKSQFALHCSFCNCFLGFKFGLNQLVYIGDLQNYNAGKHIKTFMLCEEDGKYLLGQIIKK